MSLPTNNAPSMFDPFKFLPGDVLTSPKVSAFVGQGLLVDPLVFRHMRGDWGDINDIHREHNEKVLASMTSTGSNFPPDKLGSCYPTTHFGRILVLTEPRPDPARIPHTIVLTPEELSEIIANSLTVATDNPSPDNIINMPTNNDITHKSVLVIGRLHGDDEDLPATFGDITVDEAVLAFKRLLIDEDPDSIPEAVYITHVFVSESHIEPA